MEEYLKNLLYGMEKKTSIVSQDDFDQMVKSFNMTCKWTISGNESGEFVLETWFNKEFPLFAITRIFDIDNELFDSIPKEERLKLLQSLLEKHVEVENYEKAAELRDMILELK
jgi:hypothetical protein